MGRTKGRFRAEIHQNTTSGALQNSFVYDDDGNMTGRKDGSGTTIQTVSYDAKGRAATIQDTSQSDTFTYDPFDYRIAKADSGGSKSYLLQGEHLEAVTSGSNLTAMYFRGVVVDEVVNGYQVAPGGAWVNYTFHHDNLQSVLGLSGHDGRVLQTVSYDPFGNKTATSGSATNNTLLFTGREHDPDTGLYYYRARYYDPGIGRFLTEDPKGFAAGVNFYAYAGNNPINANDPYGMSSLVYDNIEHTLTIVGQNGNVVGVYSAYNNAQSSSAGPWPGGTYNYSYHVPHPSDPNGPYGSYGNFVFDVPGHTGMGVHSGRADSTDLAGRSGVEFATNGCIRTTDEATGTIQNLISSGDPLTTIGVIRSLSPQLPIYNADSPQLPIYNNSSSSQAPITNATSDVGSANDAAAGGYLIYPNKPNTNMTRSVYSK